MKALIDFNLKIKMSDKLRIDRIRTHENGSNFSYLWVFNHVNGWVLGVGRWKIPDGHLMVEFHREKPTTVEKEER